ncbi:ribonuclease T2 [Peniophora sp. CONT]|nr:ribonuclease T2 [Peniophora sp. CONT]
MLSLALLAAAAVGSYASPYYANTSVVEPHNLYKRISSGCSATTTKSCSSSASGTCCFESPGGLLVQPQFWDTDPVTGPADSWTIHGLWPDKCDGTYEENCDSSRDYTNIATLLTNAGLSSLVTYMQEYWVSNSGTPESLWEHEWATHGTCYSTLETSCLPSGSTKGAEAVAFFQTTVNLFKSLPTHTWLENAGITPSSTKTYTLAQLQSAIKSAWGHTPAFDCDGSNVFEIYYYFYLEGSVIDGTFVPIDAPSFESGSCSSSAALKYLPKTGATSTTTTKGSTSTASAPTSTSTGTAGSIPSKATISAITSSGSTLGGLLSFGTWSTQTPGTYTLSGTPSSFKMSSSKGTCGVSSGAFSCGSGLSSSFSAVSSGGQTLLAYSGSTAFSSDASPSGSTQETVYTGTSHSQKYTLALISS